MACIPMWLKGTVEIPNKDCVKKKHAADIKLMKGNIKNALEPTNLNPLAQFSDYPTSISKGNLIINGVDYTMSAG